MTKSLLLEKFIHDIDDPLLKDLLQVYLDLVDESDEERINVLVAKIEDKFEERNNASTPA